MTADALQNGSQQQQPGANRPFPSQERANYDQDMPSSNIALQKHKGDVGIMGAVKTNILVKENDKKRVDCENETQNRQNRPALLINSKDGAKDDQEGAHGYVRGQGDYFEYHDNPNLPGEEIRKLELRDLSEMDEAGGYNGLEDAYEAEINTLMGLKSQGAAHQLQQKHLLYSQQVNSGGWENFLPKRNLRVLLVEDDDSTRNVVGALLHNCGYEVTLAASGVQAWELLKDKNSNVDLALTDVMLPSLSGISLLAKIMNQESCKQIPVVMMSSLDSVDIVFKCLSKGAVDFLVKPVRKNELKNLWQHVWRKCHSSSGSGSGSGSQTGKVQGLKDINAMGHNSGSNDNESSGLNAGGGSDNGSGTQSFWTKKGVKVESPRRPHEWDVAHCSHAAQAHADIQTKSAMLPKYRRSSLDGLQAKDLDQVMKKGLEVTTSRTGAFDFQVADNAPLKYSNQTLQKVLTTQIIEQNAHLDDEGMSDQSGTALESAVAIDLLGNIACQAKKKEKQHCSKDAEMDRGASNSPNTKDNVSGSALLPALELTLKRPHTVQEEDSKVEDRHVLRQSGASAFSRYSNSRAVLQQQPHVPVGPFTLASFPLQGGYVGHTAAPVTSIGAKQIVGLRIATPADRADPCTGSAEASTPLHLHSQLACGANNQEMTPSVVGSSGQGVIVQAVNGEGCSDSGMPTSIAVPSHAMLSFDGVGAFASARHPVFFTHSSNSPWAAANAPDQEGYAHQQYEDHGLPLQTNQQTYHHFSHHYHHHHVQHHYHHHAHKNPLSAESPEDGQTVTNPGTGAPQCGSSNMIGTVPGNLGRSGSSNGYGMNGYGNGSVNGSASGSNNASNKHNGNSNGQSGIMATAGTNGDCGNNNGNSGSGNGHGISSGNGSGVVVGPEQNCFTRREAALNKFRQKRKERCFEKKVRYQSRKRLAEQRPRVRGQFVRQEIRVLPNADQRHENNELVLADTDCDGADAEHD